MPDAITEAGKLLIGFIAVPGNPNGIKKAYQYKPSVNGM
jgi:hypothetical protein